MTQYTKPKRAECALPLGGWCCRHGDCKGMGCCAHPKQQPDPINHPPHYTQHPSGVECITITEHYNFNVGNAIKYLWRAGLKDGADAAERSAQGRLVCAAGDRSTNPTH